MICDKCAEVVCEVCGTSIPSSSMSDGELLFLCIVVLLWIGWMFSMTRRY